MNIIEQRLLRGRNLYSHHPCLLTVVDTGDLKDARTDVLPGFVTRLLELLPSLYDHRCSVGKYAGFVQTLQSGTNLAHVVEHVTLALQCLAGTTVNTGRTHDAGNGRYRVVCAYELEAVVTEAFDAAMALVKALARGEGFALAETVAALRETAEEHAIGTSTGAIVGAAKARGIPVLRLTDTANLFLLGWGARQKRLQATITADTGHIAVGIASDKQLTKTLLQDAGVPVPEGVTVRTLEQAQRAARRLGCTVTVKPLDGNHGRGVTTRCNTPDELAVAFERARAHGRTIIVERYVTGHDYRVLVADGRVAAAALRRPPAVTGDGKSTVRQLVERENLNPARGEGHTNILTKIPLDGHAETVLAEQGFTFDSVPPAGTPVQLRGNANLSTGGTAEDVTDLLPPETRALCVRAAQKIGLDVAGLDIVCGDIARPLEEQGGAIIEVNAAPGIRMHQYPSAGTPRNAGEAIVDGMFGKGDGRIPVIAVTGTNGKTTTTLMLEHSIRQSGLRTGCTTTEGVFIDGHCVRKGDCAGYWSARSVLTDPNVDFAVLETARGGILKRGLAFDRCDVAVVVNVSQDHLGLDGVNTMEDLARVKAVVAKAASRAVVLNAQDAYCVAMAADLDEQVERLYFSCDADNPVLLRHLESGGRAAYLQDGALILADGTRRHRILWAEEMPSALDGCARHNIANALAAGAAMLAAGLQIAQIADGLASFVSDNVRNPLRTNVYDVRGVKVLVDYAHNPAAYAALGQTARGMSSQETRQHRTVAVITAPGDRRDEDLEQIGETCGEVFDEVIVYEAPVEHRGRRPGERAALMAAGAIRASTRVHLELASGAALRLALTRCQPGDVMLFATGTSVAELVEALRDFDPASAESIALAAAGG
ncbi:cyanophycin synthetase [Pseudoduganella albidiflava]|uniref:Cyanophycin synthetase n=1 Tax=Pseudoduganella albidiflava TaxID=321983 RepID=A0A411X4C1_9BURK|nr:cyanophycin synthetase [Pseudoduganella albidiflava]QBI03774.1 cyanophycin synthetase [Pseudoduganella albidiflava]GGY61730.1 cyanophycin synthetase [Pseudoduganella albidiflava]